MVYTIIETLLITNCEVQIWIVQMMVQQISEMKGSQQYMQTSLGTGKSFHSLLPQHNLVVWPKRLTAGW